MGLWCCDVHTVSTLDSKLQHDINQNSIVWLDVLPFGTESKWSCWETSWKENTRSHLQSGKTSQVCVFRSTRSHTEIIVLLCSFTDAPKDLIKKLLVVDPKKRLTVSEALEHPFFQVMVIVLFYIQSLIHTKNCNTWIIQISIVILGQSKTITHYNFCCWWISNFWQQWDTNLSELKKTLKQPTSSKLTTMVTQKWMLV